MPSPSPDPLPTDRLRTLLAASSGRLAAALATRRAAAALRRSTLFDAAWYLATYPDVGAAGLDPARHYIRTGAAEGRDPGPRFSTRDYLARHADVRQSGINPLLHHLRGGAEGRRTAPEDAMERAHQPAEDQRPLFGFRTPAGPRRRVTLLTDSINPGSLFGGVATAILFAAELAARLDASLRIVTECSAPDRDAVGTLLRLHGVAAPTEIGFDFADRSRAERREIDLFDDEIFVSTAWWNTWNLLHAVAASQVIQLIQEDERMFYPHGDVHLLCGEVLATPGLRFAVNTRLLHTHLVAEGVARNGVWFEPAFPRDCYRWEERDRSGMQNFFFYARPAHPRNLYARGLAVICAAIERGVLDPERWTISFIGRDLGPVLLPCGVRPRIVQNLDWDGYAALVRQTDLGLALMHTPHPGYPALDLAACGAVAVTNRYGRKQSLAQYSANILCVEADEAALLRGLTEGVALAADLPARRRNVMQAGLGRDWRNAFRPAIDRLLAG